ncbi:MAG TPA: glycosyltransferase family 4 protein [Gemmatimonadaceae bacterium]|nr:glycosyltransferase family 4 protein [Gemmatimonadaceae bacterium]
MLTGGVAGDSATGVERDAHQRPSATAGQAARIRVVAVMDAFDVSGPGRQLGAVAAALADRGVDLTVVLFHRRGRARPPLAEHLERAGVRTQLLADDGPADVRLVGRLRDAIAAAEPDIVQTHGYRPTALVTLLRAGGGARLPRRADGSRFPWIAFFHGSTAENFKMRCYHWLDRRLMRRADRLVVMSRVHAAEFAGAGDRVRVLHNAVIPGPAATGAAAVAENELADVPRRGGAGATPLLGVVGRLSHEKGVDLFLEAFATVLGRGHRLSAVIAGDGPDRAALEAQRDRLGLAERVRFLGSIRRVDALYERLSLLVIPSRSEGLPNVLLEALRNDVPVAATTVGAVPEVVTSPLVGALTAPGSAEGIADAIERALPLLDDPAARAARRDAAERFSLERRVDAHEALYEEVLAAGVAR